MYRGDHVLFNHKLINFTCHKHCLFRFSPPFLSLSFSIILEYHLIHVEHMTSACTIINISEIYPEHYQLAQNITSCLTFLANWLCISCISLVVSSSELCLHLFSANCSSQCNLHKACQLLY